MKRALLIIVNWLVFLSVPIWILPYGIYATLTDWKSNRHWAAGQEWFFR